MPDRTFSERQAYYQGKQDGIDDCASRMEKLEHQVLQLEFQNRQLLDPIVRAKMLAAPPLIIVTPTETPND